MEIQDLRFSAEVVSATERTARERILRWYLDFMRIRGRFQ
jgi:hypothetical protein